MVLLKEFFEKVDFEKNEQMTKKPTKLPRGRVPTSTGKPGKPGKSQKKVPCMEKSWNLKKTEKSWKNHGIL